MLHSWGPEFAQRDISHAARAASSCTYGRKVSQEEFSCEEGKHPVLLFTPLLSFLAKQDLIMVTRTEKETLVVYNNVFCSETFLYCLLFQNTSLLVICSF